MGGVAGTIPVLAQRAASEGPRWACVPGAQDQHECPSNPSYRGGSASKKGT